MSNQYDKNKGRGQSQRRVTEAVEFELRLEVRFGLDRSLWWFRQVERLRPIGWLG